MVELISSLSTLLFYCWGDVLQECGKIVEGCLTCEELVGLPDRRDADP